MYNRIYLDLQLLIEYKSAFTISSTMLVFLTSRNSGVNAIL